ncbi:hypothetical protein [Mammaliicoccus lentus]|uniref:hypothetical protein n=1 Tax=Mammaliicoccus lentus TaxID=42858 RepID=UPI0010716DC9|nr:hypothetical protein [Mammaliicoccus lentus]MBF0795234.1 hypothetical protein [Mammaliicoccus lentus]TFV14630.1 hypothetical protein E4T78_11235 [Mammaliicoccus lentus]
MVKKKKPYVPPKKEHKRTTLWLHEEEAIKNYKELSENVGNKQRVVDTIGRMILNGDFDYKKKEEKQKVRANGNYLLFLEVKEKAKSLGYSSTAGLFDEILSEKDSDITKKILTELMKEE